MTPQRGYSESYIIIFPIKYQAHQRKTFEFYNLDQANMGGGAYVTGCTDIPLRTKKYPNFAAKQLNLDPKRFKPICSRIGGRSWLKKLSKPNLLRIASSYI